MSPFLQTLAALLAAHIAADFLLQNAWLAERKHRLGPLLAHGAIVGQTALIALGRPDLWSVLALTLAHIAIDAVKARRPDTLRAFLLDQGAHLVTLVVLAAWLPGLYNGGLWPRLPLPPDLLPRIVLFAAGAVLAVRAGGFAVAKLLAPYRHHAIRARVLSGGLNDAGALIGQLERGLTYLLILAGQPGAVGLLVAAKSILRFDASRSDRRMAEYVIIGTLASIGWAATAAYAIRLLAGFSTP